MEDWLKDRDLAIEKLIAAKVAEKYPGSFVSFQHAFEDYDWTIYVPKRGESKADWKSDRTGNAYLEIRNTRRNKPSGLESTKAELWAHHFPARELLLVFNPKRMLAHLRERLAVNDQNYRMTSPDGGDSNSQGVVASIDVLLGLDFVHQLHFSVPLDAISPDKEESNFVEQEGLTAKDIPF